ncbi:MAG: TRAP transporter small permease subunit [Pseudomonadota bacterium]
MTTLTAIARAITTLNRLLGRFLSYGVLILFLLLLSDVIFRYVAQAPMVWSAELSVLIFGPYAILGGGYLLARRQHVNVDLFYGELPPKGKALIDVATSFLFFLFIWILVTQSWSLAWDSVSRWERSFLSTWQPYVWPSKLMIPVAAVLLLIQGVIKLIADICILIGVEIDEQAFGPIKEADEEGPQEAV